MFEDIKRFLKEYKFNGIVHIEYDENSYTKIYNNKENEIKKNDIFPLGSISKLYYGILTLKLLQLKIIDSLDITINNLIKGKTDIMFPKKVRIIDLLVHTSGYDEIKIKLENKNYTINDFIKIIKNLYNNNNYGVPEYSTTNYIIYGYILELYLTKTMEEIFNEFLFKPYKIKNTYFTYNFDKKNIINSYNNKYKKILTPKYRFNKYYGGEILVTMESLNDFINKINIILNKKHINILLNEYDSINYRVNTKFIIGARKIMVCRNKFIASAGHFPGFHNSIIFNLNSTKKIKIIILSNIDKIKSIYHMDEISKYILYNLHCKYNYYFKPKKNMIFKFNDDNILGTYQNEFTYYIIYKDNGKLYIKSRKQNNEIIYLGDNRFYRNFFSYIIYKINRIDIIYMNKEKFTLYKTKEYYINDINNIIL